MIGPCVRFSYVRFVYDGLGETCVGFSLRRVSRGFDHGVFVPVPPVLYAICLLCRSDILIEDFVREKGNGNSLVLSSKIKKRFPPSLLKQTNKHKFI